MDKDFIKTSTVTQDYKQWSARHGKVLWLLVIVVGAIGTVEWSWLAFPIVFLAVFLWGIFASYRRSKAIEKETGLAYSEQKGIMEFLLTGTVDDNWLWANAGDFVFGFYQIIKRALLEQNTKGGLLHGDEGKIS